MTAPVPAASYECGIGYGAWCQACRPDAHPCPAHMSDPDRPSYPWCVRCGWAGFTHPDPPEAPPCAASPV